MQKLLAQLQQAEEKLKNEDLVQVKPIIVDMKSNTSKADYIPPIFEHQEPEESSSKEKDNATQMEQEVHDTLAYINANQIFVPLENLIWAQESKHYYWCARIIPYDEWKFWKKFNIIDGYEVIEFLNYPKSKNQIVQLKKNQIKSFNVPCPTIKKRARGSEVNEDAWDEGYKTAMEIGLKKKFTAHIGTIYYEQAMRCAEELLQRALSVKAESSRFTKPSLPIMEDVQVSEPKLSLDDFVMKSRPAKVTLRVDDVIEYNDRYYTKCKTSKQQT